MRERYISPSVIRRLPKYHRCLKELENSGIVRVSSDVLAKNLGFTASQVRQDFSCFGEFGQQGYGYNVSSLLAEIAGIIGVDRNHSAVIIGVGNLGRALLNNFKFKNYGFEISAAFDTDENLIGTEIGDVGIHDIERIEEFFQTSPFEVAILCVPKAFVRDVARRVAAIGVLGIWNFTNIDLSLEELGVVVENVHFADSLMTLCYEISKDN
ncbi:MAG: redox-sensing transcriptional repressor Rex [Oscillospiraceae bacterium]|nr:redox-sensing transcriptional repressor Rex [Oscillospiraceae bacterium]